MVWLFALIAFLAIVGVLASINRSQESSNKQEQAEQQPNNEQGQPNPRTDQHSQDQSKGWAKYKQAIKKYWECFLEASSKWHDAILAICTALIAMFTALLFVATVLLWWGGEKNSEKQLRAYVSVNANYIYAFGPQIPVQIRFALTNHGQTPAYHVSQASAVDILPYPLPKGFKLPTNTTPAPGSFVLHPRAFYNGYTIAKRVFSQTRDQ
jgi:hypothetical protein